MEVLVFKTTHCDLDPVRIAESALNHHPGVVECNVDLHDCYKKLSVDFVNHPERVIARILFNTGCYCKVLN